MPRSESPKRELPSVVLEESELASKALDGDRAAFDQLFDRYFNRLAWHFRHLVRAEAQAAIATTLEQVFASLDAEDDAPLAARACRMVKSTQPPPLAPHPDGAPSKSSARGGR